MSTKIIRICDKCGREQTDPLNELALGKKVGNSGRFYPTTWSVEVCRLCYDQLMVVLKAFKEKKIKELTR